MVAPRAAKATLALASERVTMIDGQKSFLGAVRAVLERARAKPLTRYESNGIVNETFEIDTKLGSLFVSVSPTTCAPFIGGSVNTAFQNVERACPFFGVGEDRRPSPFNQFNPASGKWNHSFVGFCPDEVSRRLHDVLQPLVTP